MAVYGCIALGLLLVVGAAGYRLYPELAQFGEPRYLVPLTALWGAVLTLAVRGAGRRWAPVAAGLLVALFIAHDLFSQLQVIARYYG